MNIWTKSFAVGIDRRLSGWTNSAICKATGQDKTCGPGKQLQVQECTDGTYDKCLPMHRARNVSCSLPPCKGMFLKYLNQLRGRISYLHPYITYEFHFVKIFSGTFWNPKRKLLSNLWQRHIPNCNSYCFWNISWRL